MWAKPYALSSWCMSMVMAISPECTSTTWFYTSRAQHHRQLQRLRRLRHQHRDPVGHLGLDRHLGRGRHRKGSAIVELILSAESSLLTRSYRPFSSNFKIDRIKTLAPFAMSEAVVNSFGEWLIPPALGTKIIPMGAIRAMS